ncbi:hypothetical protein NP233_g4183 [Leucocoprinus birnbaumii]|uniref:Uncharacterized protein n=1 Tax=Leucocoprinus birnbaumii TaxID=56174 RepID=A0AAD5VXW2_9AGAR|nr:hypothetical protein NP233_g4183 [Leucocoprinus birnbaumii]
MSTHAENSPLQVNRRIFAAATWHPKFEPRLGSSFQGQLIVDQILGKRGLTLLELETIKICNIVASAQALRDCDPAHTWLCPNLEIIQFTGSMFGDAAMLEFLQARTIYHQKYRVAHLRKAGIEFVPDMEQDASTFEELERLENETQLRTRIIRYTTQKPRIKLATYKHSPYNGLDPVPHPALRDFCWQVV